jgi:hypothetical protein
MIQYLGLVGNNIKTLEAHVFDELVELKWISLADNGIEEILHPIFAKNNKFEYISLSTNHIQTLHSLIFDDLPELEEVGFSRNLTINKNFYQFNMKLLRVVLKPIFNNYLLKFEDRVRELELVS